MGNAQDIRWIQRLNSFCKAFSQLQAFIDHRELNAFEEQGLVKAFEYTYELAWNLLKDYLEFQGYRDIRGSRDAIQLAFKTGLIDNGEAWMDMFNSRNLTSHIYNEETAREVITSIRECYFGLLQALLGQMNSLAES